MVQTRWWWPAAVLVAVSVAAPAWAQDWRGNGRLEGRVLDDSGKPVVGASVKLNLPSRGGGTVLKTDKNGKWAIMGLAGGEWQVTVEAEGFTIAEGKVSLGESERRKTPDIKLNKSGPAPPPPELLAAVQKGDEAYKAGRWAEARAEYQKVLGLRPDLAPQLHELIARTYSQEGNFEKSIEHLQHVLDASPDNVNLRVLMAQEALRGGMLDKGMELLKGVNEGAITSPEIFYNIAVILRNQPGSAQDEEKTNLAISYLTKAIALDPAYVDGYLQRGLTYLGARKVAEAKADFQKVVELSPNSPQGETAKKALESLK